MSARLTQQRVAQADQRVRFGHAEGSRPGRSMYPGFRPESSPDSPDCASGSPRTSSPLSQIVASFEPASRPCVTQEVASRQQAVAAAEPAREDA